MLGKDAGLIAGVGEIGVPLGVVGESSADVVIDFSVPDAAVAVVDHCLEVQEAAGHRHHRPRRRSARVHPQGGQEDSDRLVAQHEHGRQPGDEAHRDRRPRRSSDLPTGVDVEIIERHHRFKEDAPSGTALKFGEIVADAMGHTEHTHGRAGRPGKRPRNEIGYHAVRTGDNPGEHTIVFGMLGETLELRVAASNRDCYAQGACSPPNGSSANRRGCTA